MKPLLAIAACLLTACAPPRDGRQLNIAAAANLQRVLEPLAKASGIDVVPTFGSSTQLEQQIENGGPFDLFLSADTTQVDRLIEKGLADPATRAIYARGALVLWAPKRPNIRSLQDLAKPEVKKIGIANPELAPYGKAAIETLTSLQLWPALQPKAVYGPNISVVAQFADSANTDASFTAASLIVEREGNRVPIPENLHQPIDQALCIIKDTKRPEAAQQFRTFLASPKAQTIFQKFGYLK